LDVLVQNTDMNSSCPHVLQSLQNVLFVSVHGTDAYLSLLHVLHDWHTSSDVPPFAVENLPAGHSVQEAPPSAYVPAPHSEQDVLANCLSENFPDGQLVHDVLAEVLE
jgi:hypothetical protein